MAKKLFGLSVFLWILIALVVLFFVYGVGRREGFYAGECAAGTETTCKTIMGASGKNYCKWNGSKCIDPVGSDGSTSVYYQAK